MNDRNRFVKKREAAKQGLVWQRPCGEQTVVMGRTCDNASECRNPGEKCCEHEEGHALGSHKILGCGDVTRGHKARLGEIDPHRSTLHNASECASPTHTKSIVDPKKKGGHNALGRPENTRMWRGYVHKKL